MEETPTVEDLIKKIERLEREVAERKRLEADLRIFEGHFKAMLGSTEGFGIYQLVSDKKKPYKLRVAFVSASIKDILGIAEPTKFETWFDNIHPDDIRRVTQANLEAFETQRFNVQYRTYHPIAGEWRWIHAISSGGADEKNVNRYVNGIIVDISERKRVEEEYRKLEHELREKTRTLEETNTALKVLVRQREKDLADLEDKILLNMKTMVFPFIRKLKKNKEPSQQRFLIKVIETNIKQVLSSFSSNLSVKSLGLTSTEIQVAALVRQGYSSREIARHMNSSIKTIDVHRAKIRRKIGLTGRKINLRTYLITTFPSPDSNGPIQGGPDI